MKIGFTLDEKIFNKITQSELLSYAKKLGVSSVEISPDKNILPKNTYYEIAKLCSELEIDINFHVPYFADSFLYEIMNFTEYKKEIKTKYEDLISMIVDIQNIICKSSTLIIHGASYDDAKEKNTALYNTLNFLNWILNFLDNKNIDLNLALETLNKNENVIGNSREDIQYNLNKFRGSKLGICLDICHDAFNYYPGKPPLNDDFLSNIIYCHIHGINIEKSISHISLKESDIDFKTYINFLIDKQYNNILNLELLVSYCGENYLNNLFGDIEFIRNF
ncbi:TIM barrel protein [Maledivibacter halophilus]|uniref:Sugar phosphate isomerase/epimerase n=1 Tax=Maledivibacter halophilus TaxID=36842 RepID=A0A1T5IJK3_9FIRM|nr:TIM barrel protein [Maledivibacter halophilus]SKC39327.1 Sugar phosphate isomerase/epimerase [Maledivibacter halophilus]